MQKIYNKVVDLINKIPTEEDIPEQLKEGLTYYHDEEDPEKSSISTPPEDEDKSMNSIWVYEAYTPNYIGNLINGIKKNKIDFFYQKSHQKDFS